MFYPAKPKPKIVEELQGDEKLRAEFQVSIKKYEEQLEEGNDMRNHAKHFEAPDIRVEVVQESTARGKMNLGVFWPQAVYNKSKLESDPALTNKDLKTYRHNGKNIKGIYRDSKFGLPLGAIELSDLESTTARKTVTVTRGSASECTASFEGVRKHICSVVTEKKRKTTLDDDDDQQEPEIILKKQCVPVQGGDSDSEPDWCSIAAASLGGGGSGKKQKPSCKEADEDSDSRLTRKSSEDDLKPKVKTKTKSSSKAAAAKPKSGPKKQVFRSEQQRAINSTQNLLVEVTALLSTFNNDDGFKAICECGCVKILKLLSRLEEKLVPAVVDVLVWHSDEDADGLESLSAKGASLSQAVAQATSRMKALLELAKSFNSHSGTLEATSSFLMAVAKRTLKAGGIELPGCVVKKIILRELLEILQHDDDIPYDEIAAVLSYGGDEKLHAESQTISMGLYGCRDEAETRQAKHVEGFLRMVLEKDAPIIDLVKLLHSMSSRGGLVSNDLLVAVNALRHLADAKPITTTEEADVLKSWLKTVESSDAIGQVLAVKPLGVQLATTVQEMLQEAAADRRCVHLLETATTLVNIAVANVTIKMKNKCCMASIYDNTHLLQEPWETIVKIKSQASPRFAERHRTDIAALEQTVCSSVTKLRDAQLKQISSGIVQAVQFLPKIMDGDTSSSEDKTAKALLRSPPIMNALAGCKISGFALVATAVVVEHHDRTIAACAAVHEKLSDMIEVLASERKLDVTHPSWSSWVAGVRNLLDPTFHDMLAPDALSDFMDAAAAVREKTAIKQFNYYDLVIMKKLSWSSTALRAFCVPGEGKSKKTSLVVKVPGDALEEDVMEFQHRLLIGDTILQDNDFETATVCKVKGLRELGKVYLRLVPPLAAYALARNQEVALPKFEFDDASKAIGRLEVAAKRLQLLAEMTPEDDASLKEWIVREANARQEIAVAFMSKMCAHVQRQVSATAECGKAIDKEMQQLVDADTLDGPAMLSLCQSAKAKELKALLAVAKNVINEPLSFHTRVCNALESVVYEDLMNDHTRLTSDQMKGVYEMIGVFISVQAMFKPIHSDGESRDKKCADAKINIARLCDGEGIRLPPKIELSLNSFIALGRADKTVAM
jgi:hypothetical protein